MKFNFKNQKYSNEIESIEHEFKAETKDDKTELTIYGTIGESWWGESTSAADVKRVLKNSKAKEIIINLNSGGGDAFDGIAIYNQLKKHDAKVIVNIDGYAASAASIIAMAADEIYMGTGTMLMIHEAWTFAMGSKKDLKSTVNALEGLDESMADIYMTRFKGEREEIETFISNETWFTASEAIAVGLADEQVEIDAKVDADDYKNSVLARFAKVGSTTERSPLVASSHILAQFKRP